MNPVLIDAIRIRMCDHTTEALLDLWTTNDRVMWSPEAFEAIKSLLIERGIDELPSQKPPAPFAEPHSPTGDPVADYWLGWLRPILWVGIAVSSIALFYQAVAVLDAWRGGESFWLDGRWENAVVTLQYVVLPALLTTASIAGFRLAPWSRTALLTYAWVSVPVGVSEFVWQVRDSSYYTSGLLALTGHAVASAHSLVLPVVLIVLLRRPEIRSVFTSAGPAGFEPTVADPAAPATAPAGTPPNPASPAGSSSTAAPG